MLISNHSLFSDVSITGHLGCFTLSFLEKQTNKQRKKQFGDENMYIKSSLYLAIVSRPKFQEVKLLGQKV